MNRAVFLDRDGVINEEVQYLSEPARLRLIPGAARAIQRLNRRSIAVVVVTNQAGVARGLYPESQIDVLHHALAELLSREGARIDRFYYCPHHPAEGLPPYRLECACRKPQPGMLLQAAIDLELDLAHCWIVGDKASDLIVGEHTGCQAILVETGYGRQTWSEWSESFQPCYVAHDLADAVEWILG